MIREDNNTMDELIFDYLEGNLSDSEKDAFEALIADNHGLQEEVDSWKMTFIEEEAIPDTAILEDTLFKHSKKSNWALSLNSFLFLGILIVLIPRSLQEKLQLSSVHQNTVLKKETSSFKIELPKYATQATEASLASTKSFFKSEPAIAALPKSDLKNEERIVWELPQIERIQEEQKAYGFTIDDAIDKRIVHSARKKPKVHFLTKKERRDFNRKKKESREKKAEMEFLKGRIPYVVPLDSKNF